MKIGNDDENFSRAKNEELPQTLQENKQKDNRCLAISASTVQQLSVVAMGSCFKIIAQEGFHVVDFTLIQGAYAILTSIIWCMCSGVNPITNFPTEKKHKLIWRVIVG